MNQEIDVIGFVTWPKTIFELEEHLSYQLGYQKIIQPGQTCRARLD